MNRILETEFFERNAVVVAKELLGKFLVRRAGNREDAAMIVETEAYNGLSDKASHASRGLTPRNKIMFGEAGRFYVYLIYGMHWMLNVVCGPKGFPAAVLIRGVVMSGKRIEGPGRLTKCFKINKKLNSAKASREVNLWFEDRGVKLNESQIINTKRIGVDYAREWAQRLYRFVLV